LSHGARALAIIGTPPERAGGLRAARGSPGQTIDQKQTGPSTFQYSTAPLAIKRLRRNLTARAL